MAPVQIIEHDHSLAFGQQVLYRHAARYIPRHPSPRSPSFSFMQRFLPSPKVLLLVAGPLDTPELSNRMTSSPDRFNPGKSQTLRLVLNRPKPLFAASYNPRSLSSTYAGRARQASLTLLEPLENLNSVP